MIRPTNITIPIEKFRNNSADTTWDLPPWGHPMSLGVLPLFMLVGDRLIPVGTAFTTGPISFAVSALHNVREAVRHDGRLARLIGSPHFPSSATLHDVGLSVLHQHWLDEAHTRIEFTLLPIGTFDGAPPTDLVLGFPKFIEGFPNIGPPLSFGLPTPGTKVWSFGYHTTRYPKGGIPLEDVRSGKFNWSTEYEHRFIVMEGTVENIFAPKFADGFVEGPCFSFDGEILHGQSGGPVMSTDGVVLGVNAAAATTFFGKPTSLASLLYPSLFMTLRSGIELAPNFQINASQPFLYWVINGGIRTDGSEETLALLPIPGKIEPMVLPPVSPLTAQHLFESFGAWQRGEPASSRATGPTGDTSKIFRIVRKAAQPPVLPESGMLSDPSRADT